MQHPEMTQMCSTSHSLMNRPCFIKFFIIFESAVISEEKRLLASLCFRCQNNLSYTNKIYKLGIATETWSSQQQSEGWSGGQLFQNMTTEWYRHRCLPGEAPQSPTHKNIITLVPQRSFIISLSVINCYVTWAASDTEYKWMELTITVNFTWT